MATAKFNINDSFKEVFGVYARIPLYTVNEAGEGTELPDYPEAAAKFLQGEYQRGVNLVAPSGVSMWDRFSVIMPSKDENTVTSMYLPHATVAELSRAKNIVTTQLQGRNGTVKEYISMGDWQISLRGFIIDYENDLYPEEDVRRMNDIFEKDKALKINSKLLSLIGVTRIVVTDIKFPSMEGFQNVQPFELTLLSDEPIVLEVENV